MRNLPRLVPLAAALAAAFACNAADTLPQGEVLRDGQATVVRTSAARLDILQTSNRAVLDWQSFSIGTGGHVNFQQPSASSSILNRVVGIDPSVILGRLSANGMVFLVNPNGIVFGESARIDVGSLVASTANISTENFMAGRYLFDDVVNRHATIVNDGLISAADGGLIALIAPGVANSGTLRANLGRVVLASGNAFTLDLFGDQLIAFAVDDKVTERLTDLEGRALRAYVEHSGTIEAQSVLITANAARAVLDNVINLSGVVRATGASQRGGEVVLYGEDVTVTRSAVIDVSGGSGGRVTINSDNHTQFDGYVNAKSADAFVEISGKKTLGYEGSVDMSAGGRLLFDPTELDIGAAMAATLSGTMRSGATATASTTAGDLVVSAMIDGRGGVAGGGLTLTAGGTGSIMLNNDIITNNGAVTLNAGGSIMANGGSSIVPGGNLIYAGSGMVSMNAGSALQVPTLVAGAVSLASPNIVTKGIIAASGSVTFTGPVELQHSVFTSSGNILFTGTATVNPVGDEILYQPGATWTQGFPNTTGVLLTQAQFQAMPPTQLAGGTVAWDVQSANLTISAPGNITFQNGLVSGYLSPASTYPYFHNAAYTAGVTTRASTGAFPTRFYSVDVYAGGTASFAGVVGFAGANNHPGQAGSTTWNNTDSTFMLAINGTLGGAGVAASTVDHLVINGTAVANTGAVPAQLNGLTLVLVAPSNGTGGGLVPPSPLQAGSAGAFLAEINLPPVVGGGADTAALVVAANSVSNLQSEDEDAEAAQSVSQSADLGRSGGAAGATGDVFSLGFSLANARNAGLNADADYFSLNPFDYLRRRR